MSVARYVSLVFKPQFWEVQLDCVTLDYARTAIKLETDGDAPRAHIEMTEHALLRELKSVSEIEER